METAETRALVEKYYATLRLGDRDKLAECFTENVAWITPESANVGPFFGRDSVATELGGATPRRLFKMRTFKITVRHITVEGDTAIVQQTITAETRDGQSYENEYCWVYTCSDGRIAHIMEYADTLKASKLLPIED
jgi:ketosteroid isomerase-like protein